MASPAAIGWAVGDGNKAFEARVAEDMKHVRTDDLGGGSGGLTEGLVDFSEVGGILGSVAAREGFDRGFLQ